MNVLDLFSGIGGFSLGLEWSGMKTVAFCEKDQYCQKVLNKHWPDVPIFEDIHDVTNESLSRKGVGQIDLISGGFPCQSFSVAGQQRGKDDDRYLWPAMFKVIQSVKPTWVLCENVTGIISLALDEVLSDLENEAYSTQTFIIPACAVNAPHRRERVWIVGYAENFRYKQRENFGREGQTNKQIQQSSIWCQSSGSSEDVSHSDNRRHNSTKKRQIQKISRDRSSDSSIQNDVSHPPNGNDRQCNTGTTERQKQKPRESDCGAGPDWTTESPFCGVADGIPQRMERLKGLGNAVVPQIVEQIGKCIIASQ